MNDLQYAGIDRSRLVVYGRFAIGLVLLWMLIQLVDLQRFGAMLASAKLPLVALTLVGILLNFFLKTYRWAYLLWVHQPDMSFLQLTRFNFISMFLANFLPTSVASDFVRLYCVSRQLADPREAISSIVIDRVIGLFSLAILTVLSFLAVQQTGLVAVGTLMSSGIVSALLVSIIMPLALLHSTVSQVLRQWLSRWSHQVMIKQLHTLYEHFLVYQDYRRIMLKALAMSFLNLFIAVIEFYVIAQAFSAQVPFYYFVIFIPLVVFLSMIPLSVGGLGLLESALVFFFSKVGMPIEMCLSMAVLHRVSLLVSTLPGGIIYMVDGFSAKTKKLPA